MKLVRLRYDGHTIYVCSRRAVSFMLEGWTLCSMK